MLAATFDGASVNRRLVKVHDLRAKLIYRVRNVHSMDNRYLYFFSDPPHLIKTTRNCWSSSVRSLWVCFTAHLYKHSTDACTRTGTCITSIPVFKCTGFVFVVHTEQRTGHCMVSSCVTIPSRHWQGDRSGHGAQTQA